MLPWFALSAFVVVALLIDFRLQPDRPSMRTALVWSIVWTLIGVAFAAVLVVTGDRAASGEYLAGFLIEKSLSLDNLFVTYGLGALLLYTAIKIARHKSEDVDPDKTLVMRVMRRVLPMSSRYDGGRLVTREKGHRVTTPLFAAFVMVAAFDVMFAVDSIPAIFAVTTDTFVVFAANAFSLLGMVSLFFLLDGMLDRFRYLNLGLAAILGYVSLKLLFADVWHPPIPLTLAVIIVSLGSAMAASWLAERRERVAAEAGAR